MKLHSRALKIKSEFHVPDKSFYYIRIRALAEMNDWDELDKFSRSRKSPVGYVVSCVRLCALTN